jgi:hypothetical protein
MLSTEISTAMKISSTLRMKAVGFSEMLVTTYLKLGVTPNKTLKITMFIRIFPVFTRTAGSGPYSQN